jgi:hypothetical protein
LRLAISARSCRLTKVSPSRVITTFTPLRFFSTSLLSLVATPRFMSFSRAPLSTALTAVAGVNYQSERTALAAGSGNRNREEQNPRHKQCKYISHGIIHSDYNSFRIFYV